MSAPASPLARPRRTHPLAAVFSALRGEQLRTLLPVLVVAISSGRLVAVLVVGGLVAVSYGILSWWRRTWSFTDGVLHLDEGVVVRNQRRIPVERIQHVELERRLRHQLFGLAAVRVETAGSDGAELRLDAIELADAETLRSTLLERLRDVPAAVEPARSGPVPAPPPPPEVLVRLPPARLLLAGVTGPEVLAVLAAVGFLLDTVVDLGVDPDQLTETRLTGVAVALLVAGAVPVWLVVAAVIGLVRRWDLTARIVGDELRVTYGLLRRNEFVVKTPRVQDVRISHRLVLRPFGRADVRVRTAASGAGDRSRVDIPLLGAEEIERVLGRVLAEAVPLPPLVPAPPGARRRALVRGTAGGVVAGAGLVVTAVGTEIWGLAVAAPIVATAAVVRGEAWYRGLGQARAGGMTHSRVGALTRTRTVVPDGRVQSTSVVSTWFQRRRDLADLRLDLAGDAVAVVDRGDAEARTLRTEVIGV